MLAAAMVSGCAAYRPTPPAFHAALNEPYRLGAGEKYSHLNRAMH